MSPVILRVPHVLQRQPGECLAACAAMVLIYMGFSPRYDRLLKLLQVKPGVGTPAFNVRKLETLGLSVTYKQGTLAELHSQLTTNLPCIAFLNTNELPYGSELGKLNVFMAATPTYSPQPLPDRSS